MSAHATTADAHGHHEPSKFHVYVQIAMLLAVITSIEIVLIYLPFAKWLVVTGLVVLSAIKFLYVIFYFMHLKWDKVFCTILFFIGLVLAGGTLWALLLLFGAEASKPLTSVIGLLL
jgi:cytochrome c oxidase subunit IV